MNLSAHFTLDEFTRSRMARVSGITNEPNATAIDNLTWLCEAILEPVRKALGRPLFVTSGYRCPELNALVKGAANSAHMRGFAADVVVPQKTPVQVATVVRGMRELPLDTCIVEFGEWVHLQVLAQEVDAADSTPRFMTCELGPEGKPIYAKWA